MIRASPPKTIRLIAICSEGYREAIEDIGPIHSVAEPDGVMDTS